MRNLYSDFSVKSSMLKIIQHFNRIITITDEMTVIFEVHAIFDNIAKIRCYSKFGKFHETYFKNINHLVAEYSLSNPSHFYVKEVNNIHKLRLYRNQVKDLSPKECADYIELNFVLKLLFYHLVEFFKDDCKICIPQELLNYDFDKLENLFTFLSKFKPQEIANSLSENFKIKEECYISTPLTQDIPLSKNANSSNNEKVTNNTNSKANIEMKPKLENSHSKNTKINLSNTEGSSLQLYKKFIPFLFLILVGVVILFWVYNKQKPIEIIIPQNSSISDTTKIINDNIPNNSTRVENSDIQGDNINIGPGTQNVKK